MEILQCSLINKKEEVKHKVHSTLRISSTKEPRWTEHCGRMQLLNSLICAVQRPDINIRPQIHFQVSESNRDLLILRGMRDRYSNFQTSIFLVILFTETLKRNRHLSGMQCNSRIKSWTASVCLQVTVCLLRAARSFSPSQASEKQSKLKHLLMKREIDFFSYFSPSSACSLYLRYQVFCRGNLFPTHMLDWAHRLNECSCRTLWWQQIGI